MTECVNIAILSKSINFYFQVNETLAYLLPFFLFPFFTQKDELFAKPKAWIKAHLRQKWF